MYERVFGILWQYLELERGGVGQVKGRMNRLHPGECDGAEQDARGMLGDCFGQRERSVQSSNGSHDLRVTGVSV